MTDRLSAEQYRTGQGTKKPSKYRNVPVVVDNIRFDSKAEAARWCELKLMEKAGLISHLERQPEFKLASGGNPVLIRSKRYPNGRQVKYKADFAYFDGDKRIIEDVKGMRTKEFILKKAFVEAQFPAVRIVEVTK